MAGRSSARNSPRPVRRRSYTAGSSHGRTSSSGSGGGSTTSIRSASPRRPARTAYTRPDSGSVRCSPRIARSPSRSTADGSRMTSPFSAKCSAAARSSIRLPARTSMSWTSGSPTTNRRARPTATATFIASRISAPPGVTMSPVRSIASSIARRSRRRREPIVAVDPAGDRVAREVDDVAAERVELGDDGVEDPAEVRGQLLGAPLGPELGGEGLGQRGEAADVREQRRARPRGPAGPGRPRARVAGRGRCTPRDGRTCRASGSRRSPSRPPSRRPGRGRSRAPRRSPARARSWRRLLPARPKYIPCVARRSPGTVECAARHAILP